MVSPQCEPVWVFWWVWTILLYEKNLSHRLHWYVFSPVCSQMDFKLTLLKKALSQWLECHHMCLEMRSLWESFVTIIALVWLLPSVCPYMYPCLQQLYWYNFTLRGPVCDFRWIWSRLFHEKAFSQWLHLCGFSPVCTLKWIFTPASTWESFGTMVH